MSPTYTPQPTPHPMECVVGACAAAAQLLEDMTTAPRGAYGKWATEVVDFFGQCCRDVEFVFRLRQRTGGRAPWPWRAPHTAPLQTLLERLCALWDTLRRRHPPCSTRATLALFRFVHACNAHRPDDQVAMTPAVATAAVATVVARGRPGTVLLFEALHVMGWACSVSCTLEVAVAAAHLLTNLTMVDVVRSSFKAAGALDPARATVAELATHLPQALLEPLVDVVVAAAARRQALLFDAESLVVCLLVAGVATTTNPPVRSPAHTHILRQGFAVLLDVLGVLRTNPALCAAGLTMLQGPIMEVAAGLLRLPCSALWWRTDVDADADAEDDDDNEVMYCLKRLVPLCGRVAELPGTRDTHPANLALREVVKTEAARRRRVWSKRRARWVYAAALAGKGHVL